MASSPSQQLTNILSIDVEDWYHLSGEQIRGRGDILAWQLDRLLGLLAAHHTRATFFCLGGSLVESPQLVRRIAEAGHEVATHGWGHQPITQIGLDAFAVDLRRSLDWLRDLLGRPVNGHRAHAFSVRADQLEAFYDVCFEAGLTYDSSVFPIRGRRYGIPGANPAPHVVRDRDGRQLVEIPLSTLEWGRRVRPVAGGGYWRLMPLRTIRRCIERVNALGRPMVTYLHPYEFDPRPLSALKAAGLSLRSLKHGLKQNLNRRSMFGKLDAVLAAHRFGAVEDYLRESGRL